MQEGSGGLLFVTSSKGGAVGIYKKKGNMGVRDRGITALEIKGKRGGQLEGLNTFDSACKGVLYF
jgi:hypothetical protein